MQSVKCVLAIAAAVIAVSPGCRVDQAKEVALYRQVVQLNPATTRPTTQPASPLTLREALLLANQQNERFSIEGENYLQAIINRKRAVALFLPTANLAGTYALGENVGANSGSSNHVADLSAIGNINIFNGFRDVAQMKVADLTIEERRWVLLDVQESLLADVIRAYYQVLRNEQLVVVLQHTLQLQDARVRDMRGRQNAGMARPLDVAQSEAQASSTRVTLINARNGAANARTALAFLTNEPLGGVPLTDDDPLPTQVGGRDSLRQAAMAGRQDLQASIKATQAARQNVEVAVGQYYPSLSLNLRGFLYRESSPSDRVWESLLVANMPLFSAGRIEADVRQAWSQFRQAALFESLLRRQIIRDVDTAYENVQDAEERLAELDVQVTAARQAVQQAEGSYNAGLATNLERLTAQDQLLSASLQWTSELYNRRVNYADVLRSTGGLRQRIEQGVQTANPATAPTTMPLVTLTK